MATSPVAPASAVRPVRRRRSRTGLSVRSRVTAATALLVAVSLTGAGVSVGVIGARRVRDQLAQQVTQETRELAALQRGNVNASTGRRFADAAALLKGFLADNVPDTDQLLVAWYEGAPQAASPAAGLSVARRPEVSRAMAELAPSGGSTRLDVGSYGETLLDVETVRVAHSTGALAIVTFNDRAQAGLNQTLRIYALVAAAFLVLATVVAAWLSGRLLAPLRTLRHTADMIGEQDLSRRLTVTGNDDITALTHTVNGMLDRLETAFTRQREFLDDAGHELRTPLTVLRGHLELLDADDPADTRETRDLLLDEVDRMGRLVDDLLLLAKSDHPDFVTPRPVAVEPLTRELLSKAQALGDRAWRLEEAASVTVSADAQRLTQAMLQLAANAVAHTERGQGIAIGSATAGGDLRLWVRDEGPGVTPSDRRRIFERFVRVGDRAGDEGFGLGLSIVRAIALAHGGRVWVEDASDPSGARFVLAIPLAAEEAQEVSWRES